MPSLLPPFKLHQPASLAEASQMLTHFGEDARAYAGGTELLLAMKQGGLVCEHLVDLKTIPELDQIQHVAEQLRIGALATHLTIERSPSVAEHVPVLVDLERRVANVRVRATGTLGGNLCFGEPHSDPATLLLCLEASLQIAGPEGEREMTMGAFLVGSYEVALGLGEVLCSVTIPRLGSACGTSYQKFVVHEYPMLGLALVLDQPESGIIREARLAVGSVSPTPRRSRVAESLLVGEVSEVREHHIDDAADALANDAELLDDADGSSEYKRHLIRVFLRRAFDEAAGRRNGVK